MKQLLTICAVVSLLVAAGGANAAISLDVVPSSAPNVYGSASWSPYSLNALNSLENGLGNIGDRATDPTAYKIAPAEVEPGEIAVTSFNSWRGTVNPPSPFNNELGNRMHFGLHAYGDGTTQFTLEQLTFSIHSSDPGDTLTFEGDFIGYSYNGTTRYGIDWGNDRVKGGGDDIVYTSDNGQTLVDEIVYVGVGNAWWPVPEGGQTDQDAMDDHFAWVASEAPITVSCSYSIQTYSGSASVDVVPEPATLGVLALGGLLGLLRRRWA